MTLVIVPFGNDVLALSSEQLEEARSRARQLMGEPSAVQPVTVDDRLLTAEQMAERTAVPSTWFLEQARQDKLPCVRLGKYVRFRMEEVVEASRRLQAEA
jgi:excisionase family DNA binding protein